MKPPSAIAGPEDNIIIPRNAESIFPELELCVVIGKKARHLSKAQAMDVVFRLHHHARRYRARLRHEQEHGRHPQCAQGL